MKSSPRCQKAKSHDLPKRYCFRGLNYKILWRKPHKQPSTCGGTCDPPSKKQRAIEIHPTLYGENRLRVLIDESIHACIWDLDNDSVGQISTSIAGFLWKCGLRFNEQKEKK